MDSSSQQPDLSITSNDTYTIDVSNLPSYSMSASDTITLSGYSPCTVSYPSNYDSSMFSTLTTTPITSLTASQISTITIGGTIDGSSFTINFPNEWVNCFPEFSRIEKMCEEYPGLKAAYEKFVTTYKLVADHYDTPKDKRPKP
jgi:hypothetical protein